MHKLLFILLLLSNILNAQNYNRPIPPFFPNYEFEINELSYLGYYFAHAYRQTPGTKSNMFVLDSMGYVAWYRKNQDKTTLDFKYHEGSNKFSFIGFNQELGSVFKTLDTNFQRVDTLTAESTSGIMEYGDSHDFLMLSNGNKIIGTRYDTIMDLSGYIFNGTLGEPNIPVRGFGIQEFDSENNLIWRWRSTDFIHPEEFLDDLFSYNTSAFSYAHGNSIALDLDSNLIISLRHTSAIYKINRVERTGEVIWRLGGEQSSFDIPQDSTFSGQHYARVLPNGNIGIFDNGNHRIDPEYSRASEYELNFADSTATLVWSYDEDKSVYSASTGNAQWLNDDLVLVSWGSVLRPEPTFSLVNLSGDILTRLHYEDTYVSYRIQAYELPFELPRPQLTYNFSNDSVVINAPSGHAEYVWSTGETTPSIKVPTNGVYQVWVPHGIGMIGSYPLDATSVIVGDNEPSLKSFKIFPNPATDHFQIEIEFNKFTEFNMELYDSSGKKIKEFKGRNHFIRQSINSSSFPNGFYFLKVKTEMGVFTKRIILL
ncbi:aryl-sulfate sulfotransferase [Saprospiraceae bacterium]|nr:aryl-sulfate sulfotransferase [Saprospiraceae bacterium]